MAKATCPKNSLHKRFVTVAHVTEYWVVDEHGEFVELDTDHASCGEVTHPPKVGNTWTCAECGTTAFVTED